MSWYYVVEFLLVFLTSCYIVISASLIIGVSRLKKNTQALKKLDNGSAPRNAVKQDAGSSNSVDLPFVSILVPARNEERIIADCLESLLRQQYPSDRYEIVVVNDRSTDRTATIIKEYQKKYKRVKGINIGSNPSGLTGKQNALNEGLKFCIGEIILNTDADCIVGPLWARQIISYFTPQVGLTIGFSTTHNTVRSEPNASSLFTDLQSLDTLFLMDAAAGAIGMKVPVSCLGRNLAYRRAMLDNIDYSGMGYTITEDATLIQAVARSEKWDIAVAYDKDASVLTSAEKSLGQFLSQRARWILGGRATRSWSQIPLHAIFLFHLCLAISFPLSFPFMFFVPSFAVVTLSSVLAKMMLDFIRCWRVCKRFERTDLLKLFVPYEVFMIAYNILIGLGSIFIRKVRWKGEVYAARYAK